MNTAYCYKELKEANILIPFVKGNFYPIIDMGIIVVRLRKTPNSTVTIARDLFDEHFYTLKKLRKLKLKKIFE